MVKCPECDRVFDLSDETDADEWHHGHDCEAPTDKKKSNDRAFRTGWSVVKGCSCKPGIERDNCSRCEGTGNTIDFTALYHTCPKCGKRGDGIKYKHEKHGCSGVKLDDDNWRSNIEAGEPMSFRTGWSVVKRYDDVECKECQTKLRDGIKNFTCKKCGSTSHDMGLDRYSGDD